MKTYQDQIGYKGNKVKVVHKNVSQGYNQISISECFKSQPTSLS